MKALYFGEKLELKLDYPVPERKSGESLIKVLLAGICKTDVEITKNYMGFKGVLGHEFIGIVTESDNKELIGKRVAGEINCPCNKCRLCYMNLQKHCTNRSVLGIQSRDGAFAEYLVLPDENLHIVPDNITDEEATFIEPLAAAFEITDSVHIKPTDRVLQIGDGKLGYLTAQVISKTEADFTVAGKHESSLTAIKKHGIKTILASDLSPDNSFDVVVECSGNPQGFDMAVSSVRPRGIIVQKSTYSENLNVNISMLVVNEVKIIGSRCGPFEPAIRALSKKEVDVKSLIGNTYSIDDAVEALNKVIGGEKKKILIKM